MSDTHEIRELRFKVKQLCKQNGSQGRTIAALRGDLARTREEHGKIERGELRRLERFEVNAKEHLDHAHEEIKRLREKLAARDEG